MKSISIFNRVLLPKPKPGKTIDLNPKRRASDFLESNKKKFPPFTIVLRTFSGCVIEVDDADYKDICEMLSEAAFDYEIEDSED